MKVQCRAATFAGPVPSEPCAQAEPNRCDMTVSQPAVAELQSPALLPMPDPPRREPDELVACTERPEQQRLCEQLRPDDIVVVWKPDRLGRNLRNLLGFVNQLEERGVQFASVTERLDTSNSMGWLVFRIFGALAEFERERTLAGLAAARARGRQGGRPAKLTGTALERAAQSMREGRLPIDETSRIAGVSRTTLCRHLKPDGSPRNPASNTHRAPDISPTIGERGA